MPITLDGTLGITTPTYGGADTSEYLVPVTQFKNRIINGAMTIDQRNAGASFTPLSTNTFTLDRWINLIGASSKFSVQQNAGSVTPPVGFTNYYGVTSLSAYSLSSSDYEGVGQKIEGYNVADLGFGTANAKTVTVSFWVRSSLTGTFGGSLLNSAQDRAYPFTYSISSANTWEYKTVTIPGDTSGTWLTTNGAGMFLNFNLGTGSTYSGPAGAWAGSNYLSPTGATSVVSTNGATFYITGVQLEVGSTATSFDYRPYPTELALCQRYLPAWSFPSTVIICPTFVYSTTTAGPVFLSNPVAVRSPVTGITISAASNFSVSDGDSGTACNSVTYSSGSIMTTSLTWNTASGRTAFRPHTFYTNTTNAFILGTGCEL